MEIVKLNNKENFIDEQGKLLSDIWFDNTFNFQLGFGYVKLNTELYELDKRGNLYFSVMNYI